MVKRRIAAFLSALSVVAVLLLTPASALSAGGGTFWLTDGVNGTGDARGFDILPERLVNFAGLSYNSNCGASCGALNDTVSSVVFSCGVSGVTIDNTDSITLFKESGAVGQSVTIDPNYPGACSNGRIIMNVSLTLASSMTTNE